MDNNGQNISVIPNGGTISISTNILSPSGNDDQTDHDMQGNSGYDSTVTGDYKIIVSPSRKDNRRNPLTKFFSGSAEGTRFFNGGSPLVARVFNPC